MSNMFSALRTKLLHFLNNLIIPSLIIITDIISPITFLAEPSTILTFSLSHIQKLKSKRILYETFLLSKEFHHKPPRTKQLSLCHPAHHSSATWTFSLKHVASVLHLFWLTNILHFFLSLTFYAISFHRNLS